MSSKKYASPLHLEIKPSRFLFYFLVALHFFAFILLWLLPLFLIWQILISIFIIASGNYSVKMHATKQLPSSVIGLIWDVGDQWFVQTREGKTQPVILHGNSYVHPKFTLLNFKQENKWFAKAVILLWDNVDENSFRRLRVRLKITNLMDQEVIKS